MGAPPGICSSEGAGGPEGGAEQTKGGEAAERSGSLVKRRWARGARAGEEAFALLGLAARPGGAADPGGGFRNAGVAGIHAAGRHRKMFIY